MAEGCSANIFDSNFDSEEEFEGFRNDDISAYSGENDISVDEESLQKVIQTRENVESDEESDCWTFDTSLIDIPELEDVVAL